MVLTAYYWWLNIVKLWLRYLFWLVEGIFGDIVVAVEWN